MTLAQAPQHLESVDVGQPNVEHDEIEGLVAKDEVRMPARRGVGDAMARAHEHAGQPFREQCVVLDDQYAHDETIRLETLAYSSNRVPGATPRLGFPERQYSRSCRTDSRTIS